MPFAADDLATLIDEDMPNYALGTKSDASTVGGLFRNASGESFGLVGGNKPRFTVPQSSGMAAGDTVAIGGINYAVAEIETHATGLQALILEKQ